MLICIGIIIFVIFAFLRKSNKAKLSKIKDASKTNSLELEHELENKQNKVHFYIGHTWDGLELFIKNKYGIKLLIADYYQLQNYGINENDFLDLKINQYREIFLNLED